MVIDIDFRRFWVRAPESIGQYESLLRDILFGSVLVEIYKELIDARCDGSFAK